MLIFLDQFLNVILLVKFLKIEDVVNNTTKYIPAVMIDSSLNYSIRPPFFRQTFKN